MKLVRGLVSAGAAMALVSIPAMALAQNQPTATSASGAIGVNAQTTTTIGEGQSPQALPPPTSYNQPRPPVAAPAVPESGVVQQAGVGGVTAYGRAGVLELGGNIGFSSASGFNQLTISPTLGWFFMDNVQLSGIVGINYINSGGTGSTYVNLLAEPSFHIPFSQTFFGFVGLGMGLSYADRPGAGFALAPRAGVNVMVGRSGILTPAFQFVYSTSDAIQTPNGTLLAVSTSYGLSAGYTVMW